MASAARQQFRGSFHHKSASAILLTQLKEAHEQLLVEMENFDRLTYGPLPDAAELTAARWRISQASLHRRILSSKILDFLAERADDCDAIGLRAVRSENQLAMSRSAQHVHTWSLQAIRQDWKSYCEASRNIRMHMKTNILSEKQSIYPILETLAARGL